LAGALRSATFLRPRGAHVQILRVSARDRQPGAGTHDAVGRRVDSSAEEILPAFGLLGGVLFPGLRGRVVLQTVAAYGAVLEATRAWDDKLVAVFAVPWPPADDPAQLSPYSLGSLARVLDLRRDPTCGRWAAQLEAVGRVRARAELRRDPFRLVAAERLADPPADAAEVASLVAAIGCAGAPGDLPIEEQQRLLELDDPAERLAAVLAQVSSFARRRLLHRVDVVPRS
jgi:Lon protease-like protein